MVYRFLVSIGVTIHIERGLGSFTSLKTLKRNCHYGFGLFPTSVLPLMSDYSEYVLILFWKNCLRLQCSSFIMGY